MSYYQSQYNQFGAQSNQYGSQYVSQYQVRDPFQSQYNNAQAQAGGQNGFQVNFSDSEAEEQEDNIYRNKMVVNKVNSNQRNTQNVIHENQQQSGKKYDNIYVSGKNQELYKNRDIDQGQEDEFFQDSNQKPFYGASFDFQGQSATVYQRKDQVPEKPIQLIAYDANQDKFFLNQEALSIIKLYDDPISFVSVAGKYRTGKSFILNKLLNIKGKGFKVDASTQSCTQGIWMWTKPVPQDNKQIFFIDTEGNKSVEGNKKHDAKIFSLALLISSLFVYNSVGAIDDKSIQELQLTTQISRNIQVTNNVSQNDKLISQYTPKFIWLLRDFVLEVVDSNGQQISPNQYLHNCLTDQTSIQKQSPISKRVREALLQFFRQRECFTMVRPATSEEDLKNLDGLPLERLRPQFQRELNALRTKIFQMADPKMMEGNILKPAIFVELIKKYVDQINEKDGVPDIKSAWDNILEGEAQVSYEKAIQAYQEMKIKLFGSDEKTFTQKQIEENIKKLRQFAIKIFEEGISVKQQNEYYTDYKQKLELLIQNQEKMIEQENNAFADTGNQEILIEMQNDLNAQHFDLENIEEFAQKVKEQLINFNQWISHIINLSIILQNFISIFFLFKRWILKYNQEGKGSNKMEILSQYFPDILHEQLLRLATGNNHAQEIEELQAQIQTLKQQLADTKKNAELQKTNAVAEYKKQVETLKSQIANYEQAEKDNKSLMDVLKKKANNATEENQKLEQQLQAKEAELMKIQIQLKEAQLAAKKNKSKCGCF
ncbi:hypothetical protein ABPG74_004482 [Tetrahymena malaccensis]